MPNSVTTNQSQQYNTGPNLISRKGAQQFGHKRFYTGLACKHGHTVERYTTCNSCVECVRIRNATLATRQNQARYRKDGDDGIHSIYVYRLRNTKDGRYYIGSTTQRPQRRLAEHKVQSRLSRNRSRPICQAIKELGEDAWRIEGVACWSVYRKEDKAFGRSYEASRIAASIDDPLCLNTVQSSRPLPIDGVAGHWPTIPLSTQRLDLDYSGAT